MFDGKVTVIDRTIVMMQITRRVEAHSWIREERRPFEGGVIDPSGCIHWQAAFRSRVIETLLTKRLPINPEPSTREVRVQGLRLCVGRS